MLHILMPSLAFSLIHRILKLCYKVFAVCFAILKRYSDTLQKFS